MDIREESECQDAPQDGTVEALTTSLLCCGSTPLPLSSVMLCLALWNEWRCAERPTALLMGVAPFSRHALQTRRQGSSRAVARSRVPGWLPPGKLHV